MGHPLKPCPFKPKSIPPHGVQQRSVWSDEFDLQSHLSERVSGAAQTRIERAYYGFEPIEHAFLKLGAFHEMFGHLQDALVDGEIVVAGGDDHVDGGDESVVIDGVVVNEGAARGFH